jgi:hypothetical protein
MAGFSAAKVGMPTAKLNLIITICKRGVTHGEAKLDYCNLRTRPDSPRNHTGLLQFANAGKPTAKLNLIITICKRGVTHRETKLDYCNLQTRISRLRN